MYYIKRSIVIFLILINVSLVHAESIIVFTPPSTRNIMEEIKTEFEKENNIEIKFSWACASILARQIVEGADCDVFLSSNVKWMEYVKERKFLQNDTITPLLTTSLVMITSSKKRDFVEIKKGLKFEELFSGRLAMADPDFAPAGIYAREALVYYGFWNEIKDRLATVNNVRLALKLVEKEECECGIVLRTDTIKAKNIKICGEFEEKSHSRIKFSVSCLKKGKEVSRRFFEFLVSDKADLIYKKYGFKRFREE